MTSIGPLFIRERLTLHSGQTSEWKIECDHLTDHDVECLAYLIVDMTRPFSEVEGVPHGGVRIAKALAPHRTSDGGLLIVDDVLTTGRSMEEHRNGRTAFGVVLFARGPIPSWVNAVWRFWSVP